MYTRPRSEQSAYIVVNGKPTRVPLTHDEKQELLTCQEHKCADCTSKIHKDTCEIDHMWPLGLGGPDHRANMQALCHRCHAKKTKKELRMMSERRRRVKLITNEHRRLQNEATTTAPSTSTTEDEHDDDDVDESTLPAPKKMKVSNDTEKENITITSSSTSTSTTTTTTIERHDYSKQDGGEDEELKCSDIRCGRRWWTYSQDKVDRNPKLKRFRTLASHARRSHIRRVHDRKDDDLVPIDS